MIFDLPDITCIDIVLCEVYVQEIMLNKSAFYLL